MAELTILQGNAFKMSSLIAAMDLIPHKPQRLGSMGIFTPSPIRTKVAEIEVRNGVLGLIQTSMRGAPLENKGNDKRTVKYIETVRIAEKRRLTASQLADIRAFGTTTEQVQVQQEILRLLSGPLGIQSDVELTLENMRLGAISGEVKDADGSTIIDWFDKFGVTKPAEIAFEFDATSPAEGAIRIKAGKVVAAMIRASKGAWISGQTGCHALCDDDAWLALTAAKEVRETYLNQQAANELRGGLAFEQFSYGGIMWEHYRGTDDKTTVGIDTGKIKFFPVNAPGVFLEIFSPGEQFEHLGQSGKEFYPIIVPDRDRNTYADIEGYCYPLHACTRPSMLQSGRAGS